MQKLPKKIETPGRKGRQVNLFTSEPLPSVTDAGPPIFQTCQGLECLIFCASVYVKETGCGAVW